MIVSGLKKSKSSWSGNEVKEVSGNTHEKALDHMVQFEIYFKSSKKPLEAFKVVCSDLYF